MEYVARLGLSYKWGRNRRSSQGNRRQVHFESDLESLYAYFRLVAPRRRISVVRFDSRSRARIPMYGTWFDFPANCRAKKTEG